MYRKLSILILALAMLAGSLYPATGAARAAKPRVSIAVVKSQVVQGSTVRVFGKVRFAGSVLPGTLVTITAQEFPYKRAARGVKTVRTNAAGSFSARVRPRLNTRYRAIAGTLAGLSFSPKKTAYVNLKPVPPRLTVRGHRAFVSFTRQYPSGYPFKLSGRRVSWYFRRASNPIYHRVATSRSREPKADRIAAGVSFRLPRIGGTYRFFVTGCYTVPRAGADDGFGRTRAKRCPGRFRSSGRVLPGLLPELSAGAFSPR